MIASRSGVAVVLVSWIIGAGTTSNARADCASHAAYNAGIVFVTDREPVLDDRLFGGERGMTSGGAAIVTMGTLAAPRPAATRGCVSMLAFYQALQHRFVRSHGRRALIYVHAADTSFVAAAGDALALKSSAHFPGPVVLYSWPATVMAKPANALETNNAAWSAAHFEQFLSQLEIHFHGMPLSFVASGVGVRIAIAGLAGVRGNRCLTCFDRAVFVNPAIAQNSLHNKLAERRLCNPRRARRSRASSITVYVGAIRRAESCANVETIFIPARALAARKGRDIVVEPRIAHDIHEVLAGTPASAPSRRLLRVTRAGPAVYELRDESR